MRITALTFEWDERRAKINFQKHGVDFEEARTVLDDPLAAVFNDEDHSIEEAREIIIGESILNRLLVVSFTERAKNLVRIISPRRATRAERNDYEEYVQR